MKPDEAISNLVVKLGWTEVAVGILLLAALQFVIGMWIRSRLDASIKHEYDKTLEEFRYDMRVREQAAKVAQYMDLARNLRPESALEKYHEANRLAWELAIWLPADVYKRMAESIVNPNQQNNPLEVIIAVRQLLLREQAGNLAAANVIHHAPGIGRHRAT
jgi:hypothetical protein